ncbi:MAG: MFS transporter [Cyanomargarita calcarea GSE-NOS-MK-12-04C]|jgi:MFS family permease|uniref:MFS transporter n=1 Tax=Cyanomargarita calcarea GSE-NOS-MK-12-04C TaxID=2839659 RepID=A0A951UVJ6_9CYAN|nr:MFS transporter [Cyanomargarita calcarea GSE-NOS-MK-12-04C]
MMQSSDLDKKSLSTSSTYPEKQSWVSASPYVPMDTHEDTENGKTYRSETHKNDVNTQCEKKIDEPTTLDVKTDISNKTEESRARNEKATSPDLETSGGGLNGGTGGNVEQKGFLAVLKNPNFLALWGGQVFCQLADKVYLVLMIALINTQFQTSDQSISGWVSALMMAFTIPAVLFGSVAGVFVDRWSKKAVLVATNVWRGILVLVIPLLLWVTHDWRPVGNLPVGFLIILGVTFLVSTLTQFFAPAEQAAIPLVVQEQDLLSANSLYTTTMMASVIIGFAVGEPLLALAGQIWQQLGGSGGLGKEILVGGSYAIAGIILLLLVTHEKPQDTEKETPHIFTDLREGFGYVKDNHRLRNALIQLIILFSVFAALTVLAVRMAEVIENLKASQFGFLLAAGGVGIAIGATLLGQFCQRFSYTQLSLCGCVGMATSLLGLSIFTKELWVVLVLILMLGVFGALIGIPMQTAIQTETPASMRGKVFGLQNNVINIALSLPLGLAGVAESFLGLQTVFLALAAIVFSGGLFTWYNSQP